jgi:Zn-dependent protease
MTKEGLRNVLSYCFPAGRISGVQVGIHWMFPFLLISFSLQASRGLGSEMGLAVSLGFALLFGIVLAHEFGHVFAARREGIGTDRVMLWPLGGLAFLGGSSTGAAEVRIAAAGPAVNLAFALLLLPVLFVVGVPLSLGLLNPLDWSGAGSGFAQMAAFTLYKLNIINFFFNLIPAFPMDGGRVLRGLLHPRLGALKSTLVAATIGLVFAGVFGIWGLMNGELLLVMLGVFVGLEAYQARRNARYMAAEAAMDQSEFGYDFSMGHTSLGRSSGGEEAREERRQKKERARLKKKLEEDRRIEEGVDALLDKISREGIDSLSRKERTFLEEASRRNH